MLPVFLRQVCSSQVDPQHQVHLLHGRLQRSCQADGAGVVHQNVDACQSQTISVMMSQLRDDIMVNQPIGFYLQTFPRLSERPLRSAARPGCRRRRAAPSLRPPPLGHTAVTGHDGTQTGKFRTELERIQHLSSPSSAAVKMVPGSFGCGSAVLAAITTLAPSRAALRAMAFPMPRLAPVMKSVQPASFLWGDSSSVTSSLLITDPAAVCGWLMTESSRIFSFQLRHKHPAGQRTFLLIFLK